MHRNYRLSALKELRDQQVRYAPREKKIEQSRQAERLYREIDGEKRYSYRFVCVGITDFRAEMYPDLMLEGEALKHDLLLFVEDLFDAANVSDTETSERVWTITELCERLNVSAKTIARWRKQGLISRRFLFDGKKRVGILQDSLDYFLRTNPGRIERGERFSQLTSEEKQLIIRLARRFADNTTSPTEIAKRIARYIGRSVETIRYILKAFDERNADIPLFPNRHTPLGDEERNNIFQEYQQGMSIAQLAEHYCRTRGSIYRILGQMRAERIASFMLDFIDNPEFHEMSPAREKVILGPPPQSQAARTPRSVSKTARLKIREQETETVPTFIEIDDEEQDDDAESPREETDGFDGAVPTYLSGLYRIPLLTPDQELHLFRKMNYLKFKAKKLRDSLDPTRPKNHSMTRIETFYDRVAEVKNEIVSANLRLVVSIAKRHIGPYANLFDLISDGNLSLLRAVEKFDYGRGNRFSTYATWAITRNFARTIPDEKRHRDHFFQGDEEILDKTIDRRSNLQLQEQNQLEQSWQVDRLLSELNEREQKIIINRFGIGRTQEPLTLNEVGVEMGVTKERVRQIEARALAKLRKVAEEEHLEIPGL